MIVITDTNIFYSALAAPCGEIAKILSERRNVQFLVPDYLLEEIYNRQNEMYIFSK